MQIIALLSLLSLLAGADALRVAPARAAPAHAVSRAAAPLMAFEWLTEAGGPQGEKMKKGTDYLFFQAPSPITGQQEGLPGFFSKVRGHGPFRPHAPSERARLANVHAAPTPLTRRRLPPARRRTSRASRSSRCRSLSP